MRHSYNPSARLAAALGIFGRIPNKDDFLHNLICLRGELRSGLATPLPQGLLKGTLPSTSTMQAKTPATPAERLQRETAHAKNERHGSFR